MLLSHVLACISLSLSLSHSLSLSRMQDRRVWQRLGQRATWQRLNGRLICHTLLLRSTLQLAHKNPSVHHVLIYSGRHMIVNYLRLEALGSDLRGCDMFQARLGIPPSTHMTDRTQIESSDSDTMFRRQAGLTLSMMWLCCKSKSTAKVQMPAPRGQVTPAFLESR